MEEIVQNPYGQRSLNNFSRENLQREKKGIKNRSLGMASHKQEPSERYQETQVKEEFLRPRKESLQEGVLAGGRWYKKGRWVEP